MKVFIIAGEASGDRLGAALMRGLKSLKDVEFSGVGGPLMQAEGMTSLFPMEELSVMGFVEVLPKIRQLKRRIKETATAALATMPDLVISIDSPDFCLRVAKLIKVESDIRTVHYVAPSVWAWRAGRAQKMAKVIDHVLALLPFEPPYMEAAGIECDFVGHPVVSEPVPGSDEIAAFRKRHQLGDASVLLVLPGSRKAEVTCLGPIFTTALKQICQARPDLRLVVPTTLNRAAQVRELVKNWPGKPLVIAPEGTNQDNDKSDKTAAFAIAEGALAASGTVSLELAAVGTPMVIAYDVNWISRQIYKRLIKIETLTLVNLVSDTLVVPEFLGENCRAELIAPAVLELLENPEEQIDAMRVTMERLGRGGENPGLRAAKAVLNSFRQSRH
ncbi:MAG: lipid-A-disaccharide synthase [Pseudomonadota bacterium]